METIPVPIPFPGCRNTQEASLDPEVLPWGFPGIFLCLRSPNPEIFLNFSIADESLELEFRAGDAEPGFRKGTPPPGAEIGEKEQIPGGFSSILGSRVSLF